MNQTGLHRFRWLLAMIAVAVGLTSPVAAAPPLQEVVCAEVYTVQASDWLSKIADKFLGDLGAYPAIMAATNELHEADGSFAEIVNPNVIEAGWKLCIPVKREAETLLSVSDRPVAANLIAVSPGPAVYTLDDFVAGFEFGSEVKSQWIYTAPERLAPFDILPAHQTIHSRYGYRANYLWNEHLSNRYFTTSGVFDATPEQVNLYPAPWQSVYPIFRYPPNVTLPTRLTTNQFGWRGPQITLNKPARTIRIGCVGASTTVSGHSLPYSYPELVQHWLNLWSRENGYDVTFEVINLGREGIGSRDIAGVVRYEMLPLEVDYVIYYEGANQFNPRTMVSYPEDVVFGQPPEGLVPNFANIESNDKDLLDRLSEHSALAARARSLVEAFSLTGEEPPKPEQTFILPEGVDELRPNRRHLGNALALRTILGDLDTIKRTLDEQDVKMLVATFEWFAYEGMVLDPARHRNLYGYLNRVYWPITYANMRRMADFQNRVFKMWAAENGVEVIDVAGLLPKQPDLFDDAIHNTALGVRIRAWINFEALVPLLKADIEAGNLPRSDQEFLRAHPYITTGDYQVRKLPAATAN